MLCIYEVANICSLWLWSISAFFPCILARLKEAFSSHGLRVRPTAQLEAVVEHQLKLKEWPQVFCRPDPAAWKGLCRRVLTSQGASAHFHTYTSMQAADVTLRSVLSGLRNMKRSELCKQWGSEAEIGWLEGCHSALVTGGVMGMSGTFLFHQWSGPLSKILLV